MMPRPLPANSVSATLGIGDHKLGNRLFVCLPSGVPTALIAGLEEKSTRREISVKFVVAQSPATTNSKKSPGEA